MQDSKYKIQTRPDRANGVNVAATFHPAAANAELFAF
jgi:hypothetical protein